MRKKGGLSRTRINIQLILASIKDGQAEIEFDYVVNFKLVWGMIKELPVNQSIYWLGVIRIMIIKNR